METLEVINRRLKDYYGTTDNQANYRIIWSEDEFEKRLTSFTKEGFELPYKQMIELPKYRQWIKEKFVLERLTVVPEFHKDELTTPLSHEPLWVFESKNGEAIQPSWSACKFIIDQVNENIRNAGNYVKYPDKNETVEERELKLNQLTSELFGNETEVSDALAYHEAIVVPGKREE